VCATWNGNHSYLPHNTGALRQITFCGLEDEIYRHTYLSACTRTRTRAERLRYLGSIPCKKIFFSFPEPIYELWYRQSSINHLQKLTTVRNISADENSSISRTTLYKGGRGSFITQLCSYVCEVGHGWWQCCHLSHSLPLNSLYYGNIKCVPHPQQTSATF
jgi:hypothetical protein